MPLLFITRRLHIDHRYRLLICWDLNMHEKETYSKSVFSNGAYKYEEDSWKNVRQILLFSGACKGGKLAGLATPFWTLHDTWLNSNWIGREGCMDWPPVFIMTGAHTPTLGSSDFDIFLEIQYASCVFGLALKSYEWFIKKCFLKYWTVSILFDLLSLEKVARQKCRSLEFGKREKEFYRKTEFLGTWKILQKIIFMRKNRWELLDARVLHIFEISTKFHFFWYPACPILKKFFFNSFKFFWKLKAQIR